jgi:hypothetical protein
MRSRSAPIEAHELSKRVLLKSLCCGAAGFAEGAVPAPIALAAAG